MLSNRKKWSSPKVQNISKKQLAVLISVRSRSICVERFFK